jgi:CHAT domain-containing protein
MTAKLTGGIPRGTRQEKTFKVPLPSTPTEIAAGDDYKPYARPHYWSAFILIGQPE